MHWRNVHFQLHYGFLSFPKINIGRSDFGRTWGVSGYIDMNVPPFSDVGGKSLLKSVEAF